jgi:hypothetical protein
MLTEFLTHIEQNALTYAVAFARIAVFWQQVKTRLLSVPRSEINVYSVRSLVDYIRPEGSLLRYSCSTITRPTTEIPSYEIHDQLAA